MRTRCFDCIRTAAIAACVSLTVGIATAQPAGGFESPPALAASELAPAALLRGPLHSVAEPVKVEGYQGRFVIESRFGKFSVAGVRMLGVRVNELSAIEALQKVESSAAFKDSLTKSASVPIKFAEGAISDPGKTVENVGKGVGSVFGNVTYLAKAGVASAKDSASDMTSSKPKPQGKPAAVAGEAEPPSFTGDPFGYNRARREWAAKLRIDPYSSNPVLRPLLDNAARASFAGGFAVDTALGSVSTVMHLAEEGEGNVRDMVWNQSPLDLEKANEQRLVSLGVTDRTRRDFFRNKWMTPTLQTALVDALARLGKIEGMEQAIEAATAAQGEMRALFVVDSMRMLTQYHEKVAKVAKLRMSNLVPVGVMGDGALVVAASVDYVSWDKDSAAFTQRKELAGKQKTLLLAGKASDRVQKELVGTGWTVKTGLRP